MKKSYLLFVFLLLFSACEKISEDDEIHCWDCYIYKVFTEDIIDYQQYCNMSLNQLKTDSTIIQSTPGITYRVCYNEDYHN